MSDQDRSELVTAAGIERFHVALRYRGFRDITQFAHSIQIDEQIIFSVLKTEHGDRYAAWLYLRRIAEHLGVTKNSLYAKSGKLEWIEARPVGPGQNMPMLPSQRLQAAHNRVQTSRHAPKKIFSFLGAQNLDEGLNVLRYLAEGNYVGKHELRYMQSIGDVARMGLYVHHDFSNGRLSEHDFRQFLREFEEHKKSGVKKLKTTKPTPSAEAIDFYKGAMLVCGAIMGIIARDFDRQSDPRPAPPAKKVSVRQEFDRTPV